MEYVVALESHVVRFRNAHHEINGQDHFSKHSQKTCACREEELSNYDTTLGKVDSRSLKRKGIMVFQGLSINSSGSRRQLRTSEKGEREQKKKETAKGERKERRKERERERESLQRNPNSSLRSLSFCRFHLDKKRSQGSTRLAISKMVSICIYYVSLVDPELGSFSWLLITSRLFMRFFND